MPELTDSPSLKERILQETLEYVALPPKENEWTLTDYHNILMMESPDITRNAARNALEDAVRDGKVYKRDGVESGTGSNCKVYGFVEEE